MTIKPPGGTPLSDPGVGAPDNKGAGQVGRTFDSTRVAEQLNGAQTSGVASQYTRADLNNPQTVNTMVRQTVDELLQNEWGGQAGLSESDRKNLADFMSGDPTVHKQVERWLDKVLK